MAALPASATDTSAAPPASELTARPPVGRTAPPYTGVPVQALNADPVFLKQVLEATYQKSRAELADLAIKLAENPRQPALWMRVASIKHFYNDDRGAADAYEYLNRIADGDALPFYNLALIYGYNLKEPSRAIPKFEAALIRDPLNPSFYIGFANFWREVLGNFGQARAVLAAGRGKLPGDLNLAIASAAINADAGDTAEAIAYYEQALADPSLPAAERASIAAEVKRLKQSLSQ